MKIKLFAVLSFMVLGILFSGCNLLNNISSETSQPVPLSLPNGVSSSLTEFVNTEILQLLGVENARVKSYKDGECYARITGMGAAELSFYTPYFGFTFTPTVVPETGFLKPDFSQGQNAENPFADSLIVMWIGFTCDYDAATNKVTSQDSLRLLFNTNNEITYTLLCNELNQKPEFTHTEEIYYLFPAPNNYEEPGYKINGGVYTAQFLFDETQIEVTFVKSDNKYVALYAKLIKTNETK